MSSNSSSLIAPDATQGAWEFVDLDERLGLYGGVFAASFIFFFGSLFLTHWLFSLKTETAEQKSLTGNSNTTSANNNTKDSSSSFSLIPNYAKEIYTKLPTFEKADWCSRVNSTSHAIIVCIGFPWTLAQTSWSAWPFILALDDQAVKIRCIMAISCAYFAVDTLVIVYYRVPLWGVFLAHHIAAGIPLFNNVFNPDATCRRATFDLGMFLLVEFCTFFVNTQSWLETCKLKRYYKRLYVASIYGVFFSWIPLRLILPMFIMVHLYKSVVLPEGVFSGCMVAPLIAAHFICLFCFVVFFGLFFPQMIKRWRGKEKMPEDMLTDEEENDDQEEGAKKKKNQQQKGEKESNRSGGGGSSEPFLEDQQNKKKQDFEDDDDTNNNNREDSTRISVPSNPLNNNNNGDRPSAAVTSFDDDEQQRQQVGTSSSNRRRRGSSAARDENRPVTERLKEVVEETLVEVEEALSTIGTSGHL